MTTNIGTDLSHAKHLLKEGQLVAIPTETVYGLAGNALHTEAVLKIFEAKNRPHFNPLITHTSSLEKASSYLREVPAIARQLAEAFWPGPLTLLLPRNDTIPDLVTAGSPRVAVRVPNHPMTRQLLSELPFPLAAPSANPFGYISPTTPTHVLDQLGGKIPYILDGGAAGVGIESTILGVESDGSVLIYRVGGLSLEEIESVTGPLAFSQSPAENKPAGPGMLKSHYAPTTPLYAGALSNLLQKFGLDQTGILAFQQAVPGIPTENQFVLSPQGDLREAAAQLFAAMRQLDGLGLDRILAEYLPEIGLGRAINDRLRKAQEEMKE